MTKKAAPKPATSNGPKQPGGVRPGFKRASQRIELGGHWVAEAGPIYGLLVGGFEHKQKNGRGKGKIRVTYVVKLLEPTTASVKLEGGGYDVAELAAGEFCGIFGGPGLTDLKQLFGCKVDVKRQAEKKVTSNGNEMWMYDIDYSGTRRALPIRKWVESDESEPEADDRPEDDASFNPDEFEGAF